MTDTNKTILYIEDDPASRALVERTLKFQGYRVLVAECGLDGIDLARRETPDLILTDINLPDLTGREITTRLRSDSKFERTPIVALTAQSMGEQRELALAAGVTGYITKPLDVEALPTQVAFYLDGGSEKLDAGKMSDAQTRYAREIVERLETRIRELESVNTQLRRLDRMKDTFIQITAHELRTPLTLVYGYSRLLDDNPQIKPIVAHDPTLRMLLDGMNGSISRMQSIINEVVTMSRIMTNQIDLVLGPTDLGQTAAKALKTFEQAIKDRRIVVQFDRTTFPIAIRADWELMELAMRNLVSNAIKYTPDGGAVALSASTEGDSVRVSVRDHGIGIAKADQVNLFDRFNSTGDMSLHSTSKTAFRGGGIGLGLAITKGIIEAHGGRIWVESDGYDPEGCPGSAFIFTLPIVNDT
jgi:signal transduction histidine kinase